MMHLLITRPQPDAGYLAERLEKAGHQCTISPLMKYTTLPPPDIKLENTQATILTSRNALRALTDIHFAIKLLQLPLFTVGEETAKKAKDVGFTHIKAVAESAEELAGKISRTCVPADGQLLYLSGSHRAFDMEKVLAAHGLTMANAVLYTMEPVESLSQYALDGLKAGQIEGVLLLSPRTAQIYTRLLHENGIADQVRSIIHFCLSKNIARELDNLNLTDIRISSKPDIATLCELIDANSV